MTTMQHYSGGCNKCHECVSGFLSTCIHTYIHTFFSVRWLYRAKGTAQINVEGFL